MTEQSAVQLCVCVSVSMSVSVGVCVYVGVSTAMCMFVCVSMCDYQWQIKISHSDYSLQNVLDVVVVVYTLLWCFAID